MFVKNLLMSSNPFIDAYTQSDFLGKLIFIGLVTLSITCWVLLLYKVWETRLAKKHATQFYKTFQQHRGHPLQLDPSIHSTSKQPNPFLDLYLVLKKHTLDILNKNRKFGQISNPESDSGVSYLSPSDVSYVESHLIMSVANQTKKLEKNLFILSTITSLAPFLGLLGTVWGILMTFAELQNQGSGSAHQMVLGGLSLALATTVMGLLIAIPALIGYNYLRNSVRDFETEMEGFSTELLACVEMQYRKVDVQ